MAVDSIDDWADVRIGETMLLNYSTSLPWVKGHILVK